MDVIKVAILGFGTVGEGVYRTIQTHGDELQATLGKRVEVASILVRNKQKSRDIREEVLVTTDFEEILQFPQLDIVFEAIVEKEPTFTYLKQAIQKGCHIITANKEMFAHHGEELLKLAEEHHVSVGFEATVAGGIPVIQTLGQLLKINRVQYIQGILNGTSNFILTEMREKKLSFQEALTQAQENGYAEADPTNDVEGFDAFYKSMILSRIAFGEQPNWQEVEREGITSITSELIETAELAGLRFKHVASIHKAGDNLTAIVKPVVVGKEHPFYHVEGVENAVNVHSDIVGRITLQGPGAGMFPTASAMIEDLVYVCQTNSSGPRPEKSGTATISDKNNETKQQWLIHGHVKNYIHPSITWLEQINETTFIVEATKRDVDQLNQQEQSLRYFTILGEYEPIKKPVKVL
ncbi:homoserine dehydrogenase [Neobacillus sp. LXY-1]|uniref:homoserine dehydrogenase n=1 Tax=Neobacillus sp. LXY-1 TaxID=3379133 RepID=UPI003EE412C6